MTFEPHPRDYFAAACRQARQGAPRIATLRDKLRELARCGVDHVVVLRFDERTGQPAPRRISSSTCWSPD
jgi:riboflavin kinase/FMN adenylyltransferase